MREAHKKSSVAISSPLINGTDNATNKMPQQVSGRRPDLLRHVCILILPMLLLSAVLLGLVFRFRIKHTPPDDAFSVQQSLNDHDEPGVYYVDVTSTRLIFVASWSSSLAPMLVASIVALWSIQVAQRFAHNSAIGDESKLPTSYELALTLSMLNSAGFSALFDWGTYVLVWRGRRQSKGSMVMNIGTILLAGLCLSSLVLIADTWLHLVTEPVEFITYSRLESEFGYSFGLMDECTHGNNSLNAQSSGDPAEYCSLNPGGTNKWLKNPSIALKTLNNISETTTISTYSNNDTQYTYISIPSTSSAAEHVDYVSSTFGFRTQCRPITTTCEVNNQYGAYTLFQCADTFQGDLNQQSLNMAYFTDSTMGSNATASGVGNPFYFGWAALVGMHTDRSSGLSADPEITGSEHGGTIFAFMCDATSYDVEYTSVNGTAVQFEAQISNTSVSNIMQSAMEQVHLASDYLQLAASVNIEIASSAQDLADLMALSYSKAALSHLASTVTGRPALDARSWTTRIVSRVPTAPLFMLVVANLAFVVVGFVLLTIIHWSPGNRRAGDVHERLSIFGLVAETFETSRASKNAKSVKELFEEYNGQGSSRVELVQTSEGGWKYRAHAIS